MKPVFFALVESPTVKAVAALLGGVIAYVFPTQAIVEAATVAAVMIVLDTVTGVWSAMATGKPIESRKASRMLTKLVGYSIAVSVVSLTVKSLPSLADWQAAACTTVLGVIIATEALSILENLERVGVKLPRKLVKALRGHLRELNDNSQLVTNDQHSN